MEKTKFVEQLVASWPAPFVARTETFKFTGGAVEGRSVANAESLETEAKVLGRFVLGRKVCYPTRNFAEWLANRLLKKMKN